jgi:predicted dehydrogenase/threonine dehydrogenase-like Zn-dependent dehydrogenase
MRQILLNSGGARVARMPRPTAGPGAVLVRVHYSLVSVGTEIAPLRRSVIGAAPDQPRLERGAAYLTLAGRYFQAALRDPRRAAVRLREIASRQIARIHPARAAVPVGVGGHRWSAANPNAILSRSTDALTIRTDDTPGGYQAISEAIPIPAGARPVIRLQGTVEAGAIAFGVLDAAAQRWIASRTYNAGPIDDAIVVDAATSTAMTLVVSTAGAPPPSRVTLIGVDVIMTGEDYRGASDLSDTGWSVGYSTAGEVIAVGEGVTDLAAGDLVACAGAGQANHADYIVVRRNLVCRVPRGCPAVDAASATVGAIALQGVRRAAPQLGEIACVLGLGLIGQLTVQLLKSAGCYVVGLDLSAERVRRATALGLDAGATDAEAIKPIVRDATGGRGADCTIMTAATKSDAVINLAMETTRAKGRAVIVGDVGLNVQRAVFYRKEIDLLMSTSYGPGRYDSRYEDEGVDYPYAYVRWTLNRNMQAYLDLIARGSVRFEPLVDRIVSIEEAPQVYQALAKADGELPLGVVIRYPSEAATSPDPSAAARIIVIRGHRAVPAGPVKWALVGVGAFGTSMLVPQFQKHPQQFFLHAVVSRNGSRGGNFAREHRVPIFTSDLDEVLADPDIGLIVVATRHRDHASQVVRALEAGKHVFVEKPLAVDWKQLADLAAAYERVDPKPIVMVGFNRRFSPALLNVRELVAPRRAPLAINYRVNAGYLPLDHWVQGSDGGGRNVGEACHMYDTFRSLARAPVRGVTAQAFDPGASAAYLRNDNFSATITYEDGTLASLIYTALGPKELGKERLEIFCDGEAYVIDDYKTLRRASDGAVLWESREIDKGHAAEIVRLADALRRGMPPIAFDELVETTAVSLQIEDLLFGRHGPE